MDDTADEIRESAKSYSKTLAKLGAELSEIQFNFKVLDKIDADYWQKRVEQFKKYHQKGIEYYTEVHSLMSLVEKENAGLFLLSMSKLRQLAVKLIETLEKVKENPTTMSKDKQQSRWSKDLKEDLIQYSNKNIQLEKEMNLKFRDFYDRHLKKLLE